MTGITRAKARQPWKSMASSPVDFVKSSFNDFSSSPPMLPNLPGLRGKNGLAGPAQVA